MFSKSTALACVIGYLSFTTGSTNAFIGTKCSVFEGDWKCGDGNYCCIPIHYKKGISQLVKDDAKCYKKPTAISEGEACGQITTHSCDMPKCETGLSCTVTDEELRAPRPVGFCSIQGKLYTEQEMQMFAAKMDAAKKTIYQDENPGLTSPSATDVSNTPSSTPSVAQNVKGEEASKDPTPTKQNNKEDNSSSNVIHMNVFVSAVGGLVAFLF